MAAEPSQAYPVVYDWQDWPGDQVLSHFEAAAADAVREGECFRIALALTSLGAARGALGHPAAHSTLEQAEAKAIAAGDTTLIYQCVLARARHDADCGRHARALAACRRLESQAREEANSAMVRQTLFVAGTSLCHLGEHDLALEAFEEARMLLRAHPDSLAQSDHRVANGRYAAAQAQAWLMRGGLLLEATGPEAAADALQRALELSEQACQDLLGTPPRFSHVALFGLVRSLLEADRADEARDWIQQIESHDPVPPARGTLAFAFKRLSQSMIELRSEPSRWTDMLGWLDDVEEIRHPRVTGGDLRLSLLRCKFEAFEALGRYREALDCQREWSRTKAQLRARLAREHGQWAAEAMAELRAEANSFVEQALRAPLRDARTSLAHLQEALSTKVEEAERADHSVRRAIEIANQYLSVVRAEHLRPEDLEDVDLTALVDDVCDQMAPHESLGIQLMRHVDRPVVVRGDRVLLMRALGNLLSNALKHSPQGGTVSVVLRRQGHGVKLSVEDQGPGMSLEMRARIFQRFATGSVRRGNGLGLAMVARAARVHDARITVDSEPGSGTRVAILMGQEDLPSA